MKGIIPEAPNAGSFGTLIDSVKAHRASAKLAEDGYLRTQFTAGLVSEFMAAVEVHEDTDYPMLSYAFLPEEERLRVECLKHFAFEATIMSPRLRVAEARGYELIKSIFDRLS